MPALQALLFPDPRPLVERLGRDFFRQLPKRPGVYLMRDAAGVVLYVGKAKSLRQRLNSYRVANPDRLRRRHLRLLRFVERIELEECPDEAAALVRESELLLQLKPRFNRAGVWPATPRFYLLWRCQKQTLELAIAGTTASGWEVFGPFGNSVVYFRAALARLMWQAIHPTRDLGAMPCGWIHGRMDTIAVVPGGRNLESEFETMQIVLRKLQAGNEEEFVNWVEEKTDTHANRCDRELRDADLKTVVEFVRAKTRRANLIPASAANPDRSRKESHPNLPFAVLDSLMS